MQLPKQTLYMKKLVLDFETYYAVDFSLVKKTTMEYVNDPRFLVWGVGFMYVGGNAPEWVGEQDVEDFIRSVEWDETAVVCHNTNFDGYILTQYFGVQPVFYYDTKAMCRGLYPGHSARLEAMSERLFPDDPTMRKGKELINAKGILHLPPLVEEQIARYCKQDVILTDAAFRKMEPQYPPSEIDLIDLTCRMFTEPSLVLDTELATEYRDNAKEQSKENITNAGVPREVLASNLKFAEYLEKTLSLVVPVKKSPRTGKLIPALGKSDLAFSQFKRKYPEHNDLWAARGSAKSRLAETRATRFLEGVNKDGTISMPLQYYAAHTGRFGGTDKINPQNMGRGSDLRKSLTAPDGHLVFVADLSNIEVRVLAWLAGEQSLLTGFRNHEDIYCDFASSSVYNRPINKNDNPTERFVGKTCILGLGFQTGAQKLKDTLALGVNGPAVIISLDEAQRIVWAYRRKYAYIPALWRKLEEIQFWIQTPRMHGVTYGPITAGDSKWVLPNGMALRYENMQGLTFWNGKRNETTYGGRLTENLVQALARIVVTDGMLRIDKYLEERFGRHGAHLALSVHDEIVVVAPEENPKELLNEIIRLMCLPTTWAPDLPLAAEGGFDKCYSK